jgi:hypothetical protein
MALAGWLARCPLIAILRGVRPDEVVAVGEALELPGGRGLRENTPCRSRQFLRR